ncbi:hypothetical protein ACTWQB_16225 [Piscibacillus sp. B03]|uniref:hypothetical protein n=1 Tax=Piscibacillus sp. B03 TaxID=3457430 RepID=UPI003FCE02CC
MKKYSKLLSLLLVVSIFIVIDMPTSHSASGPYDVPSSIKRNWDNLYGSKQYSWESGRQLVYDVYNKKYLNNGYRIVSKDFGKGKRDYIEFRGWSILLGHRHHYSSNQSTYIAAVDSKSGETKVFGTRMRNLNATNDVAYNRGGSWPTCSESTRDVNNTVCNMKYQSTGFDAFLPIEELFPDPGEPRTWELYLVKEVGGRVVYTELVVPFNFNSLDYKGGDIRLSSGQDANNLVMLGSNDVIRRTYPRSTESGYSRGYFNTGYTYSRVTQNEDEVAVWYGVRSPHDNNNTRWVASTYVHFGGDQARLSFDPEDKPPVHIFDGMYSHKYRDGNNYWTTPNDTVRINLRQRDVDSGNKYQYLRLYGSGVDVRSRHNFDSSTSNNYQFYTSNKVSIDSASRTENTSYGRVNWYVKPSNHGDHFNVHYYYTDQAGNTRGYNDTGMNLKVDGVAPNHSDTTIWSHIYKNGNDYWTKPNDSVFIRFQQHDPHSGNKYQYMRLMRNGNIEVRSRHDFADGSSDHHKQVTSSRVSVDSAYRDQNGDYGRVRWKVTPKQHGDTYQIQRYYQDNVNNTRGYVNDGRLRVDGVAPSISLNPNSKNWTNSNVSVSVSASDSHSGVKRIRYRTYQNGSWSGYSSWINSSSTNINLTSQGQNRIHVQAEDNVGNVRNKYSGYYYIDKTDPNDSSNSITGHTYKNGSNYWIKPNESVTIRLRGYDYHSKIWRTYLQLKGSDLARAYHGWNSSNSTHLNNYNTSSHITFNSAKRTYESSSGRTKEVTFTVTPKSHGHYYHVYSLYRDNAENWSDNYSWNNTGMTVRTDGRGPTTSFEPRSLNWSEGQHDVDITVSDSHSGVKRFRYRIENDGDWGGWSSWKNGTKETIAINQIGRNRIQVESEDNVGNVSRDISGYYDILKLSFDYSPKPAYEGDDILIANQTDYGDRQQDLDVKWTIVDPEGNSSTQSSWNGTISNALYGEYIVTLDVEGNTLTKQINVRELIVEGSVEHTEKWADYHNEQSNSSHQFYSGEKFKTIAKVTDQPIKSVEVNFVGHLMDGSILDLVEELNAEPHPTYL